jgi:peptidase S1 and S6 chymotrypsin/hap
MKKSNKLIKGLETIAIIILIISFITLVYCVYISIRAEQSYGSNYQASRTAENIIKEETEDQDISQTIEKINLAVVGISKIKNKGNTIFLKDGVSSLGLGTGFIVSQDGYIVTNEHVSGKKNETCYVTLEDGRNFNAKVIWADNDIDLSIIKINTNSLNFIELGDSDNAKIAQTVYAIGNPIGIEFERTVTKGIISGTNRTIKLEEEDKTSYMEDLIQTDATINPGNSGGPLINEKGEVIGINCVKITSAEGIGFAIPVNIIKPIVEILKQTGQYEQATLGVFAYDKNIIPYINQESIIQTKLDSGVYVTNIIKNSPAEKAGIKQGDIITKIDETKLEKMSQLRRLVYSKTVGEEVSITYIRNKKEYTVTTKLTKKS